jgi:hypothetical protein
LEQRLALLPEQARWVTGQLLSQLEFVTAQIALLETGLRQLLRITPAMQWLQSLPGVGEILAPTIALEIGDINRFLSPERLASYAGTTPRVHASGGKVRYGPLRSDVNRYLKWAFVEAANSVAVHYPRYEQRHVSQLYKRLRERKGHAKAIGAVARHLRRVTWPRPHFTFCRNSSFIGIPPCGRVVPRRCKRDVVMSPPARRMNATHLRNTFMPLRGRRDDWVQPGELLPGPSLTIALSEMTTRVVFGYFSATCETVPKPAVF